MPQDVDEVKTLPMFSNQKDLTIKSTKPKPDTTIKQTKVTQVKISGVSKNQLLAKVELAEGVWSWHFDSDKDSFCYWTVQASQPDQWTLHQS